MEVSALCTLALGAVALLRQLSRLSTLGNAKK